MALNDNQSVVEGAKYVDAGSIAVGIGAFFGWLPNIAALLTVIWMVIRIWETETVRNWVKRDRKAFDHRTEERVETQVQSDIRVAQATKENQK